MSNPTVNNLNSYIFFEPDQVLTNDHLNNMFDYLDNQERLTRNKLIGIGVVCGLEIDNQTSSINISKGCGVTSKGYLVVCDDMVLTQYVTYTLPADPLYKPFVNEAASPIKQYNLWRLLSDDDAKGIEGTKSAITLPSGFLKDKVVVLFLEANDNDLKNCDTQDCNEKGIRKELIVRPLLIGVKDMEEIIKKQKKLSGEDGLSNSYIERLGLKEIPFRRFDTKATPLADAFDIYNAYLKCVDDTTLQAIAEAYSQCFSIFQPVLKSYGNTNPFKNLQADLKKLLDDLKKARPLYIQYYYDFLDDLIKAYQEFKERSFEVITECCPDEDLFPMHLMLGEATVDTQDYVRSPFRQYFISSPLFNNQSDLENEVQLLFDKMVVLTKNLFIPTFNSRIGVPIRITPSKWSSAPLSARSIPYYYNINNVARSWNPGKTKKGKANSNLSYNADSYSTKPGDMILNPLLYSIEPYNFYRIEGHIGQQFSSVLSTIISIKNTNRLPFDVIAIKAGADATDTTIKYDCHFEDIEAQFKFIRTELACKMHEPLCLAAKVPASIRLSTVQPNSPFSFMETFSGTHLISVQDRILATNKILTTFTQTVRFARKSDFLKTYCTITPNTLGSEYVAATTRFYPRPTQIDLTTISGAKAALMHLIDITESLMQTITGSATIYTFNYETFNKIYDQVISYFTEFMQAVLIADTKDKTLSPLLFGMLEAVVTCCIDERLKALMDEYAARVLKIQKKNLLSEYLKTNPGIDHKAGVPRGGTFIIVYHEAPAAAATVTAAANSIANLTAAGAAPAATASSTKLADTTSINSGNLAQILKIFDSTELQLTTAQANTLKTLAISQLAATASRDPFVIANNAVVADFYLPYSCCSDCPPVAYILPKQLAEVLSLSIDKTDFCNDDDGVYKITESPLGGTLTASAGGVDPEKLEFRPKGLAAGINKITYTLSDGRTTSVDVKITAAFDAEFKFEPSAADPFSIHFIPSNTENKIVSWNFGDGSAASAEQSPVHKFTLTSDTQTFKVILTVSDGPCVIKKEHEVTLLKPKPQIFTIKPAIFCSNDLAVATFTADPAIKDIAQIENTNGLQMEKAADGKIFFIPAKQNIQQTKDYHLVFNGVAADLKILFVADADFVTKGVDTSSLTVQFIPGNLGTRGVTWNFGDESPVSTQTSPFHTYSITGEQQTFKAKMTVVDGQCTVVKEHDLTVSKPKPKVFTLQPLVFCSKDKTVKAFTAQPSVADIAEVTNKNNLLIDKDSAGNISFIPAKQDIAQTTNYTLSYQGIKLSLKIIVPDAGFTMNFTHNPSPIAVFPTMLALKAKAQDGDEFRWRLTTVSGAVTELAGKEATVNLSQINGQGGQLTIVSTISYKDQTGVACQDSKEYIITELIMRNHLNKGEFDNLTSS